MVLSATSDFRHMCQILNLVRTLATVTQKNPYWELGENYKSSFMSMGDFVPLSIKTFVYSFHRSKAQNLNCRVYFWSLSLYNSSQVRHEMTRKMRTIIDFLTPHAQHYEFFLQNF